MPETILVFLNVLTTTAALWERKQSLEFNFKDFFIVLEKNLFFKCLFGRQIEDEHVWKNTRPNRREREGGGEKRENERERERERQRMRKREREGETNRVRERERDTYTSADICRERMRH